MVVLSDQEASALRERLRLLPTTQAEKVVLVQVLRDWPQEEGATELSKRLLELRSALAEDLEHDG